MIRCWGNDGEEGGKGVQWRRSRRRRVQLLTEKSQYCSSGIIEERKVQGNARSGLFIGTSCSYGVPGVCGHCVYLFLRGNGGPRHPGVKSTFLEDTAHQTPHRRPLGMCHHGRNRTANQVGPRDPYSQPPRGYPLGDGVSSCRRPNPRLGAKLVYRTKEAKTCDDVGRAS